MRKNINKCTYMLSQSSAQTNQTSVWALAKAEIMKPKINIFYLILMF